MMGLRGEATEEAIVEWVIRFARHSDADQPSACAIVR
jgi:hypothetical protein